MADPFRRRSAVSPLSGDAAARQGRILKLAIEALGASGAIAFLNSHDAELGGRPLDLAIASQQGFQMIADTIAQKHQASAQDKSVNS